MLGITGIFVDPDGKVYHTLGPRNKPILAEHAMYKISNSVRSTHGQDGAIVLDVQQGQMFNLNLVGSKILELLESGSTESDIVSVIVREFDANREIVEKDVREFMDLLKKHRLIADSRQPDVA
jgi:hypothetical protein